jgi:hypothetical protein
VSAKPRDSITNMGIVQSHDGVFLVPLEGQGLDINLILQFVLDDANETLSLEICPKENDT